MKAEEAKESRRPRPRTAKQGAEPGQEQAAHSLPRDARQVPQVQLQERPDDPPTHVAGFTAWRKFGRFVRKSEKGIVIIAPMTIKPKEDCDQNRVSADDDKPILRFRGVHVFDVSQTDGEPLPHPAEDAGDPGEHLDALRAHMATGGIELGYGDLPAGADGSSRGGRISIREGLTPAHEFSVLVHEFAHELLHQVDDRPESKTVRETEAVAFVVCQAIGLESGTAASDYLQLYGRNSEMLATSLDRVQRISAQIIAAATLSDAPTHES